MKGISNEHQRIKRALGTLTKFQRYLILFKLVIWLGDYYIKNGLLFISQLVLTPSGVMLNRRKTNQFHFPERRATELARSIFQILITGKDENEPQSL